ncbi:MAG TPA: NAD(P)/FAD-dependent oxidoreductase [Rhodanobacteraceae bacterium]|nr:NAD(P)/FAD-dependent oxidoreductase [Rhodanobacteraceae bacterium]
MQHRPVTIIGAGLVGSLLATLLAQRGFEVEVFERRPDPRVHGFLGGRSINLALAERGLNALRQAGLAEAVLQQAVMMRGRMVHPLQGPINLQPYGINDREVIWSVSRGELNMLLMDAAERAGAALHFDAPLLDVFFGQSAQDTNVFAIGHDRVDAHEHRTNVLIGADGAGSASRAAMGRASDLDERVEPLGHGYKELEIPPASGSTRFAIEPNALHIWPRGHYMCIALPNAQGSFTVTLFLPNDGPHPSFATLPDAKTARAFFEQEFPDALALMPTFDEDWDAHPVGQLATLYLDRWHLDGRALLLGDAAHAIVPFHGQGMNAGFEDAAELAKLMQAEPDDPAGVFAHFQRVRKPNADAIATMALENYIEMRDGVADPHYLAKRELTAALTERAPEHFMSRYRMVSFTHLPYSYCLQRGREQDALLNSLLAKHAKVADIDLDAAATRARVQLPPLPLPN